MGIGGNTIQQIEKGKLVTNDEAYKMAYTDALSVACKMLGMGADIYWDKDPTKYTKKEPKTLSTTTEPKEDKSQPEMTLEQAKAVKVYIAKRDGWYETTLGKCEIGQLAYLQTHTIDGKSIKIDIDESVFRQALEIVKNVVGKILSNQ